MLLRYPKHCQSAASRRKSGLRLQAVTAGEIIRGEAIRSLVAIRANQRIQNGQLGMLKVGQT
jgi:hypothetical protein